ncbi:MAG: 4-alpha-glucanotransferase [Chloroflexota bacterium]|nr:4-alpha-glucanotransferase [Chloroflexota bacterium]
MVRRISLALTLHNHQPVGNFGWVIAEVYERAYEPMVAALERHPGIRLSLHYSGPLLVWLRSERPDFIDRLRALVAREQIEIVGGGYYEPVLASLPERDRVGQGLRMRDELEALFGRRPAGAWLAERVWEPDLPTALVAAGYEWTILDDAHFRAAAIPEADLWGPYTTEDQGRLLRVFGTEQGLRYRIPFREVEEVIEYLREHATEDGMRVGMMGDDGEKLGAWPTTWEHCWGERDWVERFFRALEANATWLTTVTPSAWLEAHPPIGRVYLPTGSYAEMGEWALPPEESRAFAATLHAAVAEGRPEARWLRGASWRNFQVRYREANDLHKQMLRTSDAVDGMVAGRSRALALDHLYQGQSNDSYWHGLFGGIYLSDVRLATYEHLIAAEDLADADAGRLHVAERRDLDLDGIDEVRLASPGQVVTVDLAEGAGIGGWDIRPVRHALCAVLRRRPEAYHQALREHEAALAVAAADPFAPGMVAAPVSIHEQFLVKEPGLAALLHYDPYERRSGLVRFLALATTPETWANGTAVELGDAVADPYEIESLELDRLVATREATVEGEHHDSARIQVTKTIVLGGDRRSPTLGLTLTVANRSEVQVEAILALEWTITMLGGGGNPAAWLVVRGERASHDSRGSATGVTRFAQGNDQIGVEMATSITGPADLWWAPVETVSNSEGGFERVYQGAGILLGWPISLAGGEQRTVTVAHAVTTDHDRGADELA